MLTARRLYLSVVSAIALGLMLAGLIGLVRVILEALTATAAVSGPDRTREDLSLAIALTVVGTPLWLAHAWYGERLARAAGPAGAAERGSPLRSLYLSGAASVILLFLGLAVVGLVRTVALGLLGATTSEPLQPVDQLASIAILLPAWFGFLRLRRSDLAAGPLHGAAAWLTRIAVYGAALAGAIVLAVAAADLIATVLRLIVGRPALFGDADWWRVAIASDIGQGLVGALILLAHVRLGDRLAADPGPVGAGERASRVRSGWRPSLALIGTAVVGTTVAGVVASILALLLVGDEDATIVAQDAIGAILGSLPFVLLVIWAGRSARDEALAVGGEPLLRSIARILELVRSLVGLALVGVGSAYLVGRLVGLAGDGSAWLGGSDWRREVARWLAYLIVGLPVWLSGWLPVERRRQVTPALEAASAARRTYLLLASGAGLVAGAGALALILYRVIRVALGLETGNLAAELSDPIGILVAGAAILAYHALAIRADGRERLSAEPEGGSAVPERVSLELVVTGPPGGDPAAVRARLVAALPEGWSLDVRRGAGPAGSDRAAATEG